MRRILDTLAAARRRIAERIRWVNALTEREVLAAGHSVNAIAGTATRHITWLRDAIGRIGAERPASRVIERHAAMIRAHAAEIRARLAEHDRNAQQAIAHAAALVGGEALGPLLCALAAQARELRECTDAFADVAARQLVEFEQHVAAMRGEITQMVAASDETLAQIVASSHEALSHLQFQDVVAQRATHADGWLRDVQIAIACALLGVDHGVEIDPPMHAEAGGGYVSGTQPGELELF